MQPLTHEEIDKTINKYIRQEIDGQRLRNTYAVMPLMDISRKLRVVFGVGAGCKLKPSQRKRARSLINYCENTGASRSDISPQVILIEGEKASRDYLLTKKAVQWLHGVVKRKIRVLHHITITLI